VPEKQIGTWRSASPPEKAASRWTRASILYSQAPTPFTPVSKPDQISAVAYPRDKENVFIVTVQNVEVPDSLKEALRPG